MCRNPSISVSAKWPAHINEITKRAVLNAIQNPSQINEQLFEAYKARRILDRLVGYELSPLLWKKVGRGLSAGRVQSVAVKLVVDREKVCFLHLNM